MLSTYKENRMRKLVWWKAGVISAIFLNLCSIIITQVEQVKNFSFIGVIILTAATVMNYVITKDNKVYSFVIFFFFSIVFWFILFFVFSYIYFQSHCANVPEGMMCL